MSRKVKPLLIALGVSLSLILAGCSGQGDVAMYRATSDQADLSMKFSAGDVTMYRATSEMIKDFRFEQPSLDPPKLQNDQASTVIVVDFLQEIESLDSKGNAIANITIKAVKCTIKDKSEVKLDFDSKNKEDIGQPFGKVIGQMYKINLGSDGKVTVLEANRARNAFKGADYQARTAKALFSDDAIIKRHELPVLPDLDVGVLAVGDSWSRIVPSPPQLFAPKSYEKVYTVKGISGAKGSQTVRVEMNGSESVIPAETPSKGVVGIGPFAKMFDSEDSYTGTAELDSVAGKVKNYSEKLVVNYLIAESPSNQKPDVGPDKLNIRFTQTIGLELLR